jgi:hypothetical protein
MRCNQSDSFEEPAMLRPTLAALGLAALIGIAPGHPSLADSRVPFTLEIENATAKVGEPAVVRATVIPPDGMKMTSVYRHRVMDLTVLDDHGVKFDDEVVMGKIEPDGHLVFEVGVTPTEPGPHAINGVIRVSFINDNRSESKSIPLIARVTGTE